MRAIEISQPGSPEVLKICQRPIPVAGVGELLIRVEAAGINRPDLLQRAGAYPAPAGASDLPGLEVAGEVMDGDWSATAFKKGDRVCALLQGGGYAEYAVANAGLCLPLPGGLDALQAASLPETYFTVWSNVFERAGLRDAQSLLVQGGSSGIGVAAIQIAHALGHRVFATAGSVEKCRACEQFGAERAINYKTENFAEVVKQLTAGKGVDVILDMVAGDYVAQELDCLAEDGRLAIIALLGGPKTAVSLSKLLTRRLTITGATLRPRSVDYKRQIAASLLQQVWPLLEKKIIKPVIHQVFALEQAAQAHALMESGTHIGKIMLQVA